MNPIPIVSAIGTTKNEEKNIANRLKFNSFRPSDQPDISKVKKALSWEPKMTPKEGMKKLISWVRENKDLF